MAVVGLNVVGLTLIYDAVMNPQQDPNMPKFIESGEKFEPKKDLAEETKVILEALDKVSEGQGPKGITDIQQLNQPLKKVEELSSLQPYVKEPARKNDEFMFFKIFESFTPLMIAYFNGRFDIVEKLESLGLKLTPVQLKVILNKISDIHDEPKAFLEKLKISVPAGKKEEAIKKIKILLNKFGIINTNPDFLFKKLMDRNPEQTMGLENALDRRASVKFSYQNSKNTDEEKRPLALSVLARFAGLRANEAGLAEPVNLPEHIIPYAQEVFGKNRIKVKVSNAERAKQETKHEQGTDQVKTDEESSAFYRFFLNILSYFANPNTKFGRYVLGLIKKEHKETTPCEISGLQLIIAKLIQVAGGDGDALINLNGFDKIVFATVQPDQLFTVFKIIVDPLNTVDRGLVTAVIALLINKGLAQFFYTKDPKDQVTPIELLNKNGFEDLALDIPKAIKKSLGIEDKSTASMNIIFYQLKLRQGRFLDDDVSLAKILIDPNAVATESKAEAIGSIAMVTAESTPEVTGEVTQQTTQSVVDATISVQDAVKPTQAVDLSLQAPQPGGPQPEGKTTLLDLIDLPEKPFEISLDISLAEDHHEEDDQEPGQAPQLQITNTLPEQVAPKKEESPASKMVDAKVEKTPEKEPSRPSTVDSHASKSTGKKTQPRVKPAWSLSSTASLNNNEKLPVQRVTSIGKFHAVKECWASVDQLPALPTKSPYSSGPRF